MDQDDPISQFFPDQDIDLYAVLQLRRDASAEDIRKAYHRLALKYHPDKQATASEDAKKGASLKFQQVGFAYTILNDEKKRKRYDKTGGTTDSFGLEEGEDGWEAYFEDLFDRVTRGRLDEMKEEYQGSAAEAEDLKNAYLETRGAIGEVMNFIPHSTHKDEARFIIAISSLISKGELPNLPLWESSTKDEKARLIRKKASEKEAAEAEQLAKELGVWDEFYGSGKTGERGKSKGHGKINKEKEDVIDGEAEDYSALQALILKKKEKSMDSFFDGLAAKYAGTEKMPKNKGKKRGRDTGGEEELPQKKRSTVEAPDIDDEEFARLQERLLGEKARKPNLKSTRTNRRKKL